MLDILFFLSGITSKRKTQAPVLEDMFYTATDIVNPFFLPNWSNQYK